MMYSDPLCPFQAAEPLLERNLHPAVIVTGYTRTTCPHRTQPSFMCPPAPPQAAEPLLERNLHPTVIVRGYTRALEDALAVTKAMAFPIDVADRQSMLNVVQSCIGTKYTSRFGTLMAVRGRGCNTHYALVCICRCFDFTGEFGQAMLNVVQSCFGTKYTSRVGTLMAVSGRGVGGVECAAM